MKIKEIKESTIKIIIGIVMAAVLLAGLVYFFTKKPDYSNRMPNSQEVIEADQSSFEENKEDTNSPFQPIEEDPEKVFGKPTDTPVSTK